MISPRKLARLKDVDSATRDRLLSDATKALNESVKPAYEKLIAFLEGQSKRANDDAGVWKFPDGADFYSSALRRTTTTNLSADQIHEIGLKEVARIHGEMTKIKDKVGFKGDLQAFFKFMREDRQFYLPDTDEGRAKYLARAVEIIDEMKKRLDELFATKPKADIVVKAVEKFREQSAGKAFYQQPAPDGSRPGMFYVNLREMKSNPTYQLEALAYHEGIPGHHMQIAIAQELSGIPKFRKFFALHRLHRRLGPLQRAGAQRDRHVSGSVFGFRKIGARALARRTSGGRYRHTPQKMDSATGDRLPEAKYTELRSGLHRLDQSLHRDAEPGDRLQDRDDQDSRVARESEKATRKQIRHPPVSRRGADKRRVTARRAGRAG